MTIRRGPLKWVTFIGIGIVLLVVAGFCIWDSTERSKEVQQIELKLGFEVKVLDRQSHGTLKEPTRTYLVKRLDDKESEIEYRLYLNEEDNIEQWAMVKNGKTIRPYSTEEE
ncbi:hypothetical protein [Psychrobacillus lasiicapitis]|uniref:Uncharacterized protein n=1 Tax=Psychrobacillus lasiicapitis TaxID=1636719 RepID=A0A544TI24_9BACI|nr:hypothetical protein [Psychrobacillus lasiicapitis]TQR17106.1 hypothetical protein FG382_02885 [Psychrobacillus lasiicapitis]GGA24453.1 hypothetical protein GCM10011384_12020 [Psychrobacillus lasiicapitis]